LVMERRVSSSLTDAVIAMGLSNQLLAQNVAQMEG